MGRNSGPDWDGTGKYRRKQHAMSTRLTQQAYDIALDQSELRDCSINELINQLILFIGQTGTITLLEASGQARIVIGKDSESERKAFADELGIPKHFIKVVCAQGLDLLQDRQITWKITS